MNILLAPTLLCSLRLALSLSALIASIILTIASPEAGLCAPADPVVSSSQNDSSLTPIIITDITIWKHPTKAVLLKYGVKLLKVTIINKHPTFAVTFPFDPQTSPNAHRLELMFIELLRANGNWSYTLEAPEDDVVFEVKRNPRTHEIEVTNHSIKSN